MVLEEQENLDVKQAEVTDIICEKGKVKGIRVHTGTIYLCKILILITGTYLKGRIVIGDSSYESGPTAFTSNKLSDSFAAGDKLLRF